MLDSGWLPMVGPITYGDDYLFTASPPGASPMVSQITTAPPTANWMMCNTNGPYVFNNPQALVVAGTNLWVVNEGGNSLTEMDTDSGDSDPHRRQSVGVRPGPVAAPAARSSSRSRWDS